MKKLFLLIAGLGLLAALTGCILGLTAKTVFASEKIKGSGKLATRTLTVPAFDALRVSRGIQATVKPLKNNEVTIEADDNLLNKVTVKVEDRTLKISVDQSVKELSDCRISVTVPHNARLGKIEASSAARVVCEAPLTAKNAALKASSAAKIEATVEGAEKCKADASSAAEIDATIQAAECSFELSSAADISAHATVRRCEIGMSSASSLTLAGSASECKTETNSAAQLDAYDLTVENYSISTSSGSSARIRCTQELRAKASSGSSIRYKGDCRSQIRTSSGGSVRHK
ncbi:MAG: DUF2807 domain-containing protein [Alistipes sp.]|nr:DUF2807 domain-containing protein [Alistipes sp.]